MADPDDTLPGPPLDLEPDIDAWPDDTPTPTDMIPPPATREKSPLGRALADVEARDLTITNLRREIVTLTNERDALRDHLAELIVYQNEVEPLRAELARVRADREVLALRLQNLLAFTRPPS